MKNQDDAIRSLSDNATPDEASKLLDSLRWREDMIITNHEGERVWLKAHYDEQGKRNGITDCCLADDPCDRHASFGVTPRSDFDAAIEYIRANVSEAVKGIGGAELDKTWLTDPNFPGLVSVLASKMRDDLVKENRELIEEVRWLREKIPSKPSEEQRNTSAGREFATRILRSLMGRWV